MVIQLVRASIKPEQRDRWLDLIRKDAARTRAQDGCESYHVSEDVETPNTFAIVKRWTGQDAHHDHFRNPQFGERCVLSVTYSPPHRRFRYTKWLRRRPWTRLLRART